MNPKIKLTHSMFSVTIFALNLQHQFFLFVVFPCSLKVPQNFSHYESNLLGKHHHETFCNDYRKLYMSDKVYHSQAFRICTHRWIFFHSCPNLQFLLHCYYRHSFYSQISLLSSLWQISSSSKFILLLTKLFLPYKARTIQR